MNRRPKAAELSASLIRDKAELLPDDPRWRAALDEWCQHIREHPRRPGPKTPTGAARWVQAAAQMGLERFEAAVAFSTAQGYQGLYEPAERVARRAPAPERYIDRAAREVLERRGRLW